MDIMSHEEIDMDKYKNEISIKLTEAWKLSKNRHNKEQKVQYDCRAKPPKFSVGDRVFVYMPAAKLCNTYKFARPFHGPY